MDLFTGKSPSLRHVRIWGCKAEVRPYNPQLKKLDSRTISGFFIGYCTGSRGCRFYCPTHTTRIIESDRAFYFEDDLDSGSTTPRVINLHNEDIILPIPISSSSPLIFPPNRDDVSIGDLVDPSVEPPMPDTESPTVELRQSQRARKPTIPDDYFVYWRILPNHRLDVNIARHLTIFFGFRT